VDLIEGLAQLRVLLHKSRHAKFVRVLPEPDLTCLFPLLGDVDDSTSGQEDANAALIAGQGDHANGRYRGRVDVDGREVKELGHLTHVEA